MIVYRLTNTVNGKQYIGITRKLLERRWSCHVWDAKNNRRSMRLHKAIRKYGPEAFLREVIHRDLSADQAIAFEVEEIERHGSLIPNGYNISPGGCRAPLNPRRGFKVSAETRAKMHLAAVGRKPSAACIEASRKFNSAMFKGKKLSEEHREKVAAAKIGALNPQFGKKRPAEIRARITATLTGKKHSEEFAQKCRDRMRSAPPPVALLTHDDVRAIRAAKLTGESRAVVGERHGISRWTVTSIWTGKRWSYVV